MAVPRRLSPVGVTVLCLTPFPNRVDDYLIFLIKNNMPNKLIKWSIGLQIHISQRFILIEVIK